jgi:glutathione reductase (NADPH)
MGGVSDVRECFKLTVAGLCQVLMATGRKPKTQNIGLEDIGVELDDKGGLKVTPDCEISIRLHPQTSSMQLLLQKEPSWSNAGSVIVSMQVDEFSRSVSVPSIWGIGDVTNRIPLTPVARMEGSALAKHLFG